jgi:hypothetical protein
VIGLILSCIGLLVVFCIVKGFSLWTIGAIITTGMFLGRRFKYYVKFEKMLILEGVCLFFNTMLILVVSQVNWVEFGIGLALRLIFYVIAWYDITYMVYVNKEERREE